jgi:hypothetical protein
MITGLNGFSLVALMSFQMGGVNAMLPAGFSRVMLSPGLFQPAGNYRNRLLLWFIDRLWKKQALAGEN